MTPELIAAIHDAALELPVADVDRLAAAVERHWVASPGARHAVLTAVPTPRFAVYAAAVLDAWSAAVPGPAVALALRSSARTAAALRAESAIDIAWTGPVTREVPVRATRQVLLEVIRAASARLVVVSFAAYRVADISDALRDAAGRGVDVRLVLESAEQGKLRVDAAQAFSSLGTAVSVWMWPPDERPVIADGTALIHAKAAVADAAAAFVTSANLTGRALDSNIELGLVVTGGPVPRRLAAHWRELMDQGVLRRVDRG